MVIYNTIQELIVSIKQGFPEIIITETFFLKLAIKNSACFVNINNNYY